MENFDKNQLEYLRKFKDKLVDGVSKDDVVSLESFIGTPVITEKHKINRFTEARSNTLCREVDEEITKILTSNPLDVNNSYEELVEIMFDTRSRLEQTKYRLLEFSKVDRELMNLFVDERFIYRYRDEDELHNIVDTEPVFSALMLHGEYLNNVLNAYSGTDRDRINEFLNNMSDSRKEVNDQAEMEILSLLNILCTNQISRLFYSYSDLDIEKTTMKSVYDFWSTKIMETIKSIDTVLISITDDLSMIRDNPDNYSVNSKTSFRDMFRRYKHFNGVVRDDASLYILKLLGRLLYVKKDS